MSSVSSQAKSSSLREGDSAFPSLGLAQLSAQLASPSQRWSVVRDLSAPSIDNSALSGPGLWLWDARLDAGGRRCIGICARRSVL